MIISKLTEAADSRKVQKLEAPDTSSTGNCWKIYFFKLIEYNGDMARALLLTSESGTTHYTMGGSGGWGGLVGGNCRLD